MNIHSTLYTRYVYSLHNCGIANMQVHKNEKHAYSDLRNEECVCVFLPLYIDAIYALRN